MGFDQSAKMHQYSKTTHGNMEKSLVLQAGFVAVISTCGRCIYKWMCQFKDKIDQCCKDQLYWVDKKTASTLKFFSHQLLSELSVLDLELLSSESSNCCGNHGISWRVQALEELEVAPSKKGKRLPLQALQRVLFRYLCLSVFAVWHLSTWTLRDNAACSWSSMASYEWYDCMV